MGGVVVLQFTHRKIRALFWAELKIEVNAQLFVAPPTLLVKQLHFKK